jgi:predicted Rossmann fold flavoprotein
LTTVLVIGGGAAGMMAAAQAALSGAEVTILERNSCLGKKLSITGGGRCNLTHAATVPTLIENIPGNGRFLYSAFTTFNSQDCQRFFTKLGVHLKVEVDGRVFPVSDRSHDVIAAFQAFLVRSGARIQFHSRVQELLTDEGRIIGVVAAGHRILSPVVILASGGTSYPETGSTGDGYRLAKSVGHTIIEPKPSLVPLETEENWPKSLAGLSLPGLTLTLYEGDRVLGSRTGDLLFTHFGVSGPAVLLLSRLVTHRTGQGPLRLTFNLLPGLSPKQLDGHLQHIFATAPCRQLATSLAELLPRRLAPVVSTIAELDPAKPVHQVTKIERSRLLQVMTALTLKISGTRPLSQAIVTAGGVSTKEINPRTMGSKLVSGLFFAGEVIDVDGYTGGYNLQAAFSTGYLAGKNAAVFHRT